MVPHVTVDEVLDAIAVRASQRPDGAVAFDGDGTLWSGDIGDDLFDTLVDEERFTQVAHEALIEVARAHRVDPSGTPSALARRIYDAYANGQFPEETVFEMMTWAFAGWSRAELDAFAERVLDAHGFASRVHGEALRVVEALAAREVAVHVVSASPRAIVEAAARRLGIDPRRVSAATEARDANDVVRAAVDRPIPYGPGKVARLTERVGARPIYAAFGDNAFDAPLLRAAAIPVAVRPKPRLLALACEIPGLAILTPL